MSIGNLLMHLLKLMNTIILWSTCKDSNLQLTCSLFWECTDLVCNSCKIAVKWDRGCFKVPTYHISSTACTFTESISILRKADWYRIYISIEIGILAQSVMLLILATNLIYHEIPWKEKRQSTWKWQYFLSMCFLVLSWQMCITLMENPQRKVTY